MKILVFSDSHGKSDIMKSIIDAHLATLDYVFHLGDGLREFRLLAQLYPDKCFFDVGGNGEEYMGTDSNTVYSALLEIEGMRFFLTHGHREGVKSGYERLICSAMEKNADVVLFGHTHQSEYKIYQDNGEKPIHLFNPGSVSLPKESSNPHFGIIDIISGKPAFNCAELERIV